MGAPRYRSPIEWDNVILYGQYVSDRAQVRWRGTVSRCPTELAEARSLDLSKMVRISGQDQFQAEARGCNRERHILGRLWPRCLGSFFIPPPVGTLHGQTDVVFNFAKFTLTSFVGLMIVPLLIGRGRRDLRVWTLCSTALMVTCVFAFVTYMTYRSQWTCLYDDTRVVIGSEYTNDILEAEGGKTSKECFELLRVYPGGPEYIWTGESIERHRLILSLGYVTCIPLFACCLIAVTQAVYCATRVR